MGRKFASGTSVSVDKSVSEIKKNILRFGAEGFQLTEIEGKSFIAFMYQGRHIRMGIDLPYQNESRFLRTPEKGLTRTKAKAYEAWENECRRKWRGLGFVIKAMLVSVDEGVTKFDEIFMPYMLGSSDQTVGEIFAPRVEKFIKDGKIPKAFGYLTAGKKETNDEITDI